MQDARGQIFWDLGRRGRGRLCAHLHRSASRRLASAGHDEPIAIRFASPPDYENPTDANSDGVYKVTMVATDSAWRQGTRPLTIFVG